MSQRSYSSEAILPGDEVYEILTDKCTECVGFYDESQCAAVCPVDACVPDPDNRETREELEAKAAKLKQ